MFHSALSGFCLFIEPAMVYCSSSTTRVSAKETTATSRNFWITTTAEPLAERSRKMPKMNSGSAGTMMRRMTPSMIARNSTTPRNSTLEWKEVMPTPTMKASTSAVITGKTGGSTISVAEPDAEALRVTKASKPDPSPSVMASTPPPDNGPLNSQMLVKYASRPAARVEP